MPTRPGTNVYTGARRPENPGRQDMEIDTEAKRAFDTRPGRHLSAPPWRETGRETVKRVLGTGDVNLPVEKKRSVTRPRSMSKR